MIWWMKTNIIGLICDLEDEQDAMIVVFIVDFLEEQPAVTTIWFYNF